MKKQIVASVMAVLSFMSLTFSSCQMLTKTEYAYPKASINEKGELIFTYPDGRIQNVGVVKGADGMDGVNGTNGKDGASGVGISNANINEKGELILTYSTGESINLGVVQGANGANGNNGTDGINGTNGINGKDGVGIQEAKINDKGELVLTYTNDEVVNLGVVKGADGSKLTIGANGHFYIDGKDTFYVAGERDVIKISSDGKKFTEESKEKVTIRNVPATTKVFDESKMNVQYYYDKAGELTSKVYTTNNIEDVYAFYDKVTKAKDHPYNGILTLVDTSNLGCFNTTYSIQQFAENHWAPNTFFIDVKMEGIIQFDDGRDYRINIYYYPSCLDYENTPSGKGMVKNENGDVFTKYVCYDGNAFLNESIIEIPKVTIGTGNVRAVLGLYYKSLNADNPYDEIVATSFEMQQNYYNAFTIEFYDDSKYTNNGYLTQEEISLVTWQICEKIKNNFIVYDYYDYYSKQFD